MNKEQKEAIKTQINWLKMIITQDEKDYESTSKALKLVEKRINQAKDKLAKLKEGIGGN